MFAYIVRRLLFMVPTLLLLLFLVVFMVRLIPGNVTTLMLQDNGANAGSRAQLNHKLGLDKSLAQTYVEYVGHAVEGDFGRSLWSGQPVMGRVASRIPITLALMLEALVITVVIAIPVGVLSAVAQDTPLDYLLRGGSTLFLCVPVFVIATMVIILPAIWWGWSPNLQITSLGRDFVGTLRQLLLPAVIVGLGSAASLARITRTQMLEVLREDYVRTARAKGLSGSVVVLRHALRNGIIPVITTIGLIFGSALSGAVVIEQIFAIPGMGQLLLQSVNLRDYPFVQAIVVLIGVWVMLVNLVVDVSYGLIDPKIRLA
jgi:peptide/nickel transport system permease protein